MKSAELLPLRKRRLVSYLTLPLTMAISSGVRPRRPNLWIDGDCGFGYCKEQKGWDLRVYIRCRR